MSGSDLQEVLYPPIEPFATGFLSVSSLHTIAFEQSGNPNGEPVLVIHGGPGGGSQPSYRQYFDPTFYHIIQFDQRGCGKSTPHAELLENNTMASVSDIENLRQHLGIEKWRVFGGSWGSTLSLIYAIHYPQRVSELMLRGIFMCRKSELKWFYQDGASHIFADAFSHYENHIPLQERGDLISAYYKRLTSEDIEVQRAAAKQWTRWEMATSHLIQKPGTIEKSEDIDFAIAFARIECHYFVNGIFLEDEFILKNTEKISQIPTSIVQGRYDVVCPMKSAWELHQVLENSRLIIIPDAGHSMSEVGIAEALVSITDASRLQS